MITVLVAVLGPLLTVGGGFLLARMLRPKELIDTLSALVDKATASAERAERKADTALIRQRYYEDYVNALRYHIETGQPPPPPEYPPELLRISL